MARRLFTRLMFFVLVFPYMAAATAQATQADQSSVVVPVSIRIPRALVNTTVEPLEIPGGVPEEPSGTWVAGWYEESGGLGDMGVPLLYGYRDFEDVGPSVFYFLDQLVAGDIIEVTGSDDLVYRYQVGSLDTYDVTSTDPNLIFAPSGSEQLMLFTYGPPYDSVSGYTSIVMVRATLVETGGAESEASPPATTGCSVPPRGLALPGGPIAPAPATSGARESLEVANAVVTNVATIADIEQVVQSATDCDVVIRAAVTLPDARVLALLGPAGTLDFESLTADGGYATIAADPAATAMEFVLFTQVSGGWQADAVPWS